ncbi:MAG: hypothetical protein ACTHKB_06520 [Burkholderiaceae bacterium]
MKTEHGVITLVQEHRFQMEGDDGVRRLFILSHRAPLEWRDLESLEKSGRRVAVTYTDAPHLIAATAHDVRVADDEPDRDDPSAHVPDSVPAEE